MNEDVIRALMLMSEFYDKDLSEAAATMLMEDLSEYAPEDILKALRQCRRELRHFPLISDIVARINPADDPEAKAMLTSETILRCVRADGWNNAERAKERMGAFAWSVVGGAGGYRQLCESLTERNETAYRRQFSDVAKAIQKGAVLPEFRESKQLPEPETPSGHVGVRSLADVLKLVEDNRVGGGEQDGKENQDDQGSCDDNAQDQGHDQAQDDREEGGLK